MTAQSGMRLTLLSFKRENCKFSNIVLPVTVEPPPVVVAGVVTVLGGVTSVKVSRIIFED